MNSPIRYIERKDLDAQKWNQCIDQSQNGLIYGYSSYLDNMAVHWDALVLNDYEGVMPLTWNRKFGYYYLYQPAFTACLGVFGKNITEQLTGDFLSSIPKYFKLIEINLNAGNIFSVPSGFSILRKNYFLKLHKSYEELHQNFRENIRRNIKKAVQAGCTVKKNIPIQDVIGLARAQLSSVTNVKPEDFQNFEKLFNLLNTDQRQTYGIYREDKLLSAAVFLFSHGRAYYILAGNHPDGKTLGTSHYLVDRFIADHAGTPLVLDFEGSDVQSLAFFYESFGSELEVYPAIRINNLPWIARLLNR